MRRYATPTAIISVSSGRTKISINGLAKMKTNTDTRSEKTTAVIMCTNETPVDTVVTSGPEVLCNKGGKGIPKFLHGHIGERVNLHSCRKSCHYRCSKAVDGPPIIRDSQIHHRLLDASQCREGSYFLQASTVKTHIFMMPSQFRTPSVSINDDAQSSYSLSEDSGRSHAMNPPIQL